MTHSAQVPATEYVRSKLVRTEAIEPALDELHRRLLEQLSAYSPIPAGARVLDIACGTGRWATYLAGQGLGVHCVDLQREFLVAARDAASRVSRSLEVVQGNAEALPFPNGAFQVVTLFSVLEHVPDWERVISEALRVLEPGGVLWFTTTNRLCPITDEIRGLPLYPWYPAAVKARVMPWVQLHRPDLVAFSPAPAIHWFTYGEMMPWLASKGCVETATLVDFMVPRRRSWRSVALEALRVSPLLRRIFWVVHPGMSLMTRKGPLPSATRIRRPLASVVRDASELLACPRCKGPAGMHSSGDIDCARCQLRYPVVDGIPVMLEAEARPAPRPVEAR